MFKKSTFATDKINVYKKGNKSAIAVRTTPPMFEKTPIILLNKSIFTHPFQIRTKGYNLIARPFKNN
jgi:hypothetical protein